MATATAAPSRARVLVLDADQGSALAVVQSLGRRGLRVDVASHGPGAIAARSRYTAQALQYPDPLLHEQGFVDWLAAQMQQVAYAVVIPVTERSLVPLSRLYHAADRDRIAMAPAAALQQVLDKDQTMALAVRLGIPVPSSIEVASLDEARQAAGGLGWPVVVKPARSVGVAGGKRVQLSVAYAFDATGLDAAVRHALRFGSVLLQEYFRGSGVGVELIANQGTIRHAFQHRRLHEVPLTGGGSSLRISEPVHPALLSASRQLMQALGWHGGDFRLIEINGRFWGSLPLALAAGADFPAWLYELMTTGQVGDHPPPRSGVVCRHLARDVDWLEHVLRRAAPPALVTLPTGRQVLKDALMVFSPRHHFDIQSLRDPWPGLVDLWRLLSHQARRASSLWQRRRFLAAQWRAAQPGGQGVRQLQGARRVLFLCHGNINRSAVAQVYAQARHGGRFSYVSAGFHDAAGRPADPAMVAQAARVGLDLAGWQSQTVEPAMLAEADLVYVMEQAHFDRVLALQPQLSGRVFLLGAASAASAGECEIPDPYGRPDAQYAAALTQVVRSVDAWMQRVVAVPAATAG
jgi:protein-tyrosine-phosphatase/predicted ATP-grasp superfamily ATP-dependent carboligase